MNWLGGFLRFRTSLVDARLVGLFSFALARQLVKAVDGRSPEHGCVASDRGLTGALDPRHAPIQRLDQLTELLQQLGVYLHDLTPVRVAWRREAFHTSPQLQQRQ